MKTRRVRVGDGAPWVYAEDLVVGDRLEHGGVLTMVAHGAGHYPYVAIEHFYSDVRTLGALRNDLAVRLWDKPARNI